MKKHLFVFIFFGLLFNSTLESLIPYFNFFDEIICLCIILQAAFVGIIRKKIKIIYLSIFLLSFFVLVSTFNSQYFRGLYLSILDLFIFFKMLVLLPFYLQMTPLENYFVLNRIAKFSSLIIFSALIFLFTFHIINFPFYEKEFLRFGINSFYIFSSNPGEFGNQVLLLSLFVFMSDFNKKEKKRVFFTTVILLISTLRYKFFAFSFLLVFFYKSIIDNDFRFKNKSKFFFLNYKFIILFTGIYYIVINQFNSYFSLDLVSVTPRLRFIFDSIDLAMINFPYGIGPGTFGSPIAKLFYSPIYYELGYHNFYGMSSSDPSFLNDNFWPMLFAQYGLIFVILYIYLVYRILQYFFSRIKAHITISIIAILCLISSTLGASISTGVIGGSFIIFLVISYNSNKTEYKGIDF